MSSSQALAVRDVRWFDVDGQKYLFDPVSCKIALCSATARAVLETAQGRRPAAVVELLKEPFSEAEVTRVLRALEELGFIAEGELMPQPPRPRSGTELHELYLQVAHDCNLRCSYCYAGDGGFGSRQGLMDHETAEAAIEMLISHGHHGAPLQINLDGGEPLLNREVIGHTSELARARSAEEGVEITLAIGTNGTLLDAETAEWLCDQGIEIGLSIDGPREVHDAHRVFEDGRGSYDVIRESLASFERDGHLGSLQARATVTRLEGGDGGGGVAPGCLRQSLEHLLELGFRHVYLEPASGAGGPWLFSYDDLEALKLELNELADLYVERLTTGRPFLLRNLYEPLLRLHRRAPRHYRCRAGFGLIAVTPRGEIYPCSKFVGLPEYVMGTVHDRQWPDDLAETFVNNTTDARSGCRSCWARGLCGGGCPYSGALARGIIAERDRFQCDLERHIASLAIKVYVRVNAADPSVWDRLLAGPRSARMAS